MTATRKAAGRTEPIPLTLLIFAVIGFMYFTGEVLKPCETLPIDPSLAVSPEAT